MHVHTHTHLLSLSSVPLSLFVYDTKALTPNRMKVEHWHLLWCKSLLLLKWKARHLGSKYVLEQRLSNRYLYSKVQWVRELDTLQLDKTLRARKQLHTQIENCTANMHKTDKGNKIPTPVEVEQLKQSRTHDFFIFLWSIVGYNLLSVAHFTGLKSQFLVQRLEL